MAVSSTSLFKLTRITADAVIKATPGKIWAIQLEGGTDASSLDFHDDIDDATGDILIGVTAPCVTATSSEASTVFCDYTSLGGITFPTGIFVNWTGTAAVGYVWTS